MNTITEEEKEEFLGFLKQQAEAGKSTKESIAKYAASEDYKFTEEQLQKMVGMNMIFEEELQEVSAGSAFPVGTPDQTVNITSGYMRTDFFDKLCLIK